MLPVSDVVGPVSEVVGSEAAPAVPVFPVEGLVGSPSPACGVPLPLPELFAGGVELSAGVPLAAGDSFIVGDDDPEAPSGVEEPAGVLGPVGLEPDGAGPV